MARELHILPSADDATPRQVRAATVASVLWVALWIGLAIWVSDEVGRLEQLSVMAEHASRTVGHFAGLLQGLDHVPFIGPALAAASVKLRGAGASLRRSGVESQAGLEQLSTLLAVAIAGLPIVPFVAIFVRLRTERRRESAALRSALENPERRKTAVRYLANRAMTNLPYHELFRDGVKEAWLPEQLAEAELRRLGLGDHWHDAGVGPDPPRPPAGGSEARTGWEPHRQE